MNVCITKLIFIKIFISVYISCVKWENYLCLGKYENLKGHFMCAFIVLYYVKVKLSDLNSFPIKRDIDLIFRIIQMNFNPNHFNL